MIAAYPIMTQIEQNVRELLEQKGMSLRAFCTSVGINTNTLYEIFKRGYGKIPTLDKMAEVLEVTRAQLEGSISPPPVSENQYSTPSNAKLIPVRIAEDHEQTMIEIIPVSARAGYGYVAFMNRPAEEKEYAPVPNAWLKPGISPQDHCIVEIDGDSMEPRLSKGDKMLAYRLAPGMFTKLGKIVMIDFKDELIIKRLVAVDWMNNSVTVKSDNGGMQMVIPMADIRAMHHVYRYYDAEI